MDTRFINRALFNRILIIIFVAGLLLFIPRVYTSKQPATPAVPQNVAEPTSRRGLSDHLEKWSASTLKKQQTSIANMGDPGVDRKRPLASDGSNLSSVNSEKERTTICNQTKTLPQSIMNKIKSYLYFIGHASSGHSIVGSILDSHPHIVVSHEFDVIDKLNSLSNKLLLFNGIWKSSCTAITGKGWRSKTTNFKGYTLAIDNLYQGAYQSHIDVIGDKRGDMTVKLYMKDRDEFETTFRNLSSIVKLPMKVIHVIRNPYDNIGTQALFGHEITAHINIKTLKNSDHAQFVDPKLVDKCLVEYFDFYKAIEEMKVKYNLDVLEVHGKDLIADPKKVLTMLCDFLQVNCPSHFLTVCADKIFPKESKTRYKLKWSNEQIKTVKNNINRYPNLHRYLDFDS